MRKCARCSDDGCYAVRRIDEPLSENTGLEDGRARREVTRAQATDGLGLRADGKRSSTKPTRECGHGSTVFILEGTTTYALPNGC